MFFADEPIDDSLGQFNLYNQTRDQETANEKKYQLNFVHAFDFILTARCA